MHITELAYNNFCGAVTAKNGNFCRKPVCDNENFKFGGWGGTEKFWTEVPKGKALRQILSNELFDVQRMCH